MTAPVSDPFRLVKALDDEHDRIDVIRNRLQPLVVLVGVLAAGRQQLDDASDGAIRAEDFPALTTGIAWFFARIGAPASRIIAREDRVNEIEILFHIGDEDRP